MTLEPKEQKQLIAERLRTAREAAGLSQGQTAKIMNLHRPTISEIEAGRRRVSSDELTKFAEIYAVDVSWLLSKEEANLGDDKILLAARQLSKMNNDDLDRLMKLIHMLKK